MTAAPKKKPKKKYTGKYQTEIHLTLTSEMYQFLHLISDRTHTPITDLIREAIRAHLDEQEGVIASRSRLANRIARQLEVDRQHLTRCVTLILAAQLVPLINQGARGSQILEQVGKIAKQADDQIRALIADKKSSE